MKSIIKRFLIRQGYHIYASHKLPIGFNWKLDLERLSKPNVPATFFDVGANEGQTAVPLAQRFRNAKIHCFEPVSATFEKLKHNTNNYANVKCEHCALGGENKVVTLYPNVTSAQTSLLPELNQPKHSAQKGEEIQIRTVDEVLAQKGISDLSLLKTDTEGFDVEVLKGAQKALRSTRIDIIVSEVSFYRNDREHTSFSEIHRFLEGFDYALYGIYEQNHWEGRLAYADALFTSPKLRRECPREFATTFLPYAD